MEYYNIVYIEPYFEYIMVKKSNPLCSQRTQRIKLKYLTKVIINKKCWFEEGMYIESFVHYFEYFVVKLSKAYKK